MSAVDPSLPNLDVRVIAFSLREERLHVLLDRATIPATQVGMSQPLEDAASGLLYHLTGLRETYLEQLYTYGESADEIGRRRVAVTYFALLPATSSAASIHSDAGTADWFPLEALPTLAPGHADMLAYALRRLRYKLEYSAVGFQLLPEHFTLSELQRTYEMILGEQLDKRNFRRRILQAGIIEPTAQLRGGEGRPARLYRYRPDAVAEVKTRRLFP